MKKYKNLFKLITCFIVIIVLFLASRTHATIYDYTNNLNLSVSNLILPLGSSATISSLNSNYNGSNLYVSNNSNPTIASTSSSLLIPGCTATSLYSIVTGQPCLNNYSTNYSNNTGSIIISALLTGTDTITLCQNNGSACNTITVVVIGNNNYIPANTYYNYSNPINAYNNNIYSNNGQIPIIYSSSSAQDN